MSITHKRDFQPSTPPTDEKILNMKKEAEIKLENQDRFKVEKDPKLITKLYSCPFCLGLATSMAAAKDHGTNFHRIYDEHWDQEWKIDTVEIESLLSNDEIRK